MIEQDKQQIQNYQLQIPIIDISLSNKELIVQQLRDICLKHGFFYLKGYNIDENLINEVFQQQKLFFSQSKSFKENLAAKKNKDHRGWTDFQEEKLDYKTQLSGDTKEGFTLAREVNENDQILGKLPFHGPNQWPQGNEWVQWRNVMEKYSSECEKLGLQLLKFFSLSLGQEENFLDKSFQNPMIFLRLLHYNDTISQPKSGVYGAGAHTDYGLFTFLKNDEVPGLEIFYENQWIRVNPLENCFIVNLGDMVSRLSNNKYKSTLHRVVNDSGKERYSIVYFFEPDFTAYIDPLLENGEKSQYDEKITAGEHLIRKFNLTYNYKENEESNSKIIINPALNTNNNNNL